MAMLFVRVRLAAQVSDRRPGAEESRIFRSLSCDGWIALGHGLAL